MALEPREFCRLPFCGGADSLARNSNLETAAESAANGLEFGLHDTGCRRRCNVHQLGLDALSDVLNNNEDSTCRRR